MKNVPKRKQKPVRKEENAGYQHFLLFSQCFPNLFTSLFFTLKII